MSCRSVDDIQLTTNIKSRNRLLVDRSISTPANDCGPEMWIKRSVAPDNIKRSDCSVAFDVKFGAMLILSNVQAVNTLYVFRVKGSKSRSQVLQIVHVEFS